MKFIVKENDLTLALLYGCPLARAGHGSKADAREQARKMIAAADALPIPAVEATPATESEAVQALKRLVYVLSKKFSRSTQSYKDAMQDALNAIHAVDPEWGVK